jgi:hypothetical protein
MRAPTVTTPVPPTPVTSRSKGPVQVQRRGLACDARVPARAPPRLTELGAPCGAAPRPPPSRSSGRSRSRRRSPCCSALLDGGACVPSRSRPGITDRQLLCLPAVAAALADRSLMNTRCGGLGPARPSCGAGAFRRRRSARRSAPSRPGTSRSSALHGVEFARSWKVVPAGTGPAGRRSLSISSDTTTTASRPRFDLAGNLRPREVWPSTGWPPVIATASLYRIL